MENSLLSIFDEIWSKTMYYSTGTLLQYMSTLLQIKFLLKSAQNFYTNQPFFMKDPVLSLFKTILCSY